VTELAPQVRGVLERGVLCHVAALTGLGPHVTPMVFAFAGGSVWVTTARGSVKAGAWRSDPRVSGLVRAGEDAVAIVGKATAHDALDPSSWARSVARAPTLSLAAARFTRKNARFFAGYAVDAHRVPLAWTPPGRVFVELSVERVALLEGDREPMTWGEWGGGTLPSGERFRAARSGEGPLERLPSDVGSALGAGGRGALAVEGADGPVVLPATWTIDGAALYALVAEDALALASPSSASPRAALGMDRPSSWRARGMVGAMARGVAEIHVVARLSSGGGSATAIAARAGIRGERLAVVRLRRERFVWWRGWDAGTVTAA
jgi:nitroimidazol reductase NimA-like FMN-containing flavoprotein (pyridoxamine 5'-phosphate oxidase superfamily)